MSYGEINRAYCSILLRAAVVLFSTLQMELENEGHGPYFSHPRYECPYGYSGRFLSPSEIQHMIARTIANLEDEAISAKTHSSALDRFGNPPRP